MVKTMADKKAQKDAQSVSYTKEQLLASKKYQSKRDVLNALLDKGKTYTMEQVDTNIDKFMKGEVR